MIQAQIKSTHNYRSRRQLGKNMNLIVLMLEWLFIQHEDGWSGYTPSPTSYSLSTLTLIKYDN